MSAKEYRKIAQSSRFKDENQFEAWVIKILRTNGWIISSMKDSRKQRWDTHKGIPDIVAFQYDRCRILFAELKMPGKKPTEGQHLWLRGLEGIAEGWSFRPPEGVFVKLWYPEDEQEIIKLAGGKVPLG